MVRGSSPGPDGFDPSQNCPSHHRGARTLHRALCVDQAGGRFPVLEMLAGAESYQVGTVLVNKMGNRCVAPHSSPSCLCMEGGMGLPSRYGQNHPGHRDRW